MLESAKSALWCVYGTLCWKEEKSVSQVGFSDCHRDETHSVAKLIHLQQNVYKIIQTSTVEEIRLKLIKNVIFLKCDCGESFFWILLHIYTLHRVMTHGDDMSLLADF